ncbi:AAA family ATPase [Sphingobacterium kyonggiense]|uniref:AAA family ATPase n=1 Tax=Sphingobacterium kyonggiense TaxID=714075 RepID=A0ABP7YE27_9SPHI
MLGLILRDNFYVLSGGPAAGKTSLLLELQKRGYAIAPEIARELIKEQQLTNGNALPWKDKILYKEIMFDRSIQSFKEIDQVEGQTKPIFFDRSFIDSICYARLIQSEVSEQMIDYVERWRYNTQVFMLPPWKEIYETDSERKQQWEEAVLTYEMMVDTYKSYGYQIIELPKTTVNERADFVIKAVQK